MCYIWILAWTEGLSWHLHLCMSSIDCFWSLLAPWYLCKTCTWPLLWKWFIYLHHAMLRWMTRLGWCAHLCHEIQHARLNWVSLSFQKDRSRILIWIYFKTKHCLVHPLVMTSLQHHHHHQSLTESSRRTLHWHVQNPLQIGASPFLTAASGSPHLHQHLCSSFSPAYLTAWYLIIVFIVWRLVDECVVGECEIVEVYAHRGVTWLRVVNLETVVRSLNFFLSRRIRHTQGL